ncbi:MAG: TniQ family protein [Nitrospira sp.]|nr:MAG: TniQ family protein [Nitrospira sp.]
MIGWFPNLYPDELLSSACARYADTFRYPARMSAISDLFGDRCSRVAYDVPGQLNRLVSQLPSNSGITLEELLYRHTLFPFYVSTRSPEKARHIIAALGDSPATVLYRAVGMITYRQHCPQYLRFCDECVKEDVSLYGEPYWHRLHQIPGVLLCTKHECHLMESKVGAQGASLVSAKTRTTTMNTGRTSRSANGHLLGFANDARRIVEEGVLIQLSGLRFQYRTKLESTEFIWNDRLSTDKLGQAITGFYTSNLLHQLSFSAYSNDMRKLVNRVLGGPNYHPLEHLVMMRFLHMPLA